MLHFVDILYAERHGMVLLWSLLLFRLQRSMSWTYLLSDQVLVAARLTIFWWFGSGAHAIAHHGLQSHSPVHAVWMAREVAAKGQTSCRQNPRFGIGNFHNERSGEAGSDSAHIPPACRKVSDAGSIGSPIGTIVFLEIEKSFWKCWKALFKNSRSAVFVKFCRTQLPSI